MIVPNALQSVVKCGLMFLRSTTQIILGIMQYIFVIKFLNVVTMIGIFQQ